jgi:hypothetical protein
MTGRDVAAKAATWARQTSSGMGMILRFTLGIDYSRNKRPMIGLDFHPLGRP